MSSQALLMVLCSALLHAAWNFAAKRASGGAPFVWLYGMVSIAVSAPVAWWIWRAAPQQIGTLGWALVWASAIIHLFYALLLQHGYRVADFSVVYPVARGSGPLFSVFGAILAIGEAPTPLGALGIAMILGGVFGISGVGALLRPGRAMPARGVGWGLATGACIAAYTLVDGWAIKKLGLAPVPYYTLQLVARNALLTPLVCVRPAELRRQARAHAVPILVVGLLSPLAYGLVLSAMRIAPLSYVAPARELAMMFGTIAGMWLLREPHTWGRLAGVALMTGGVLMLNLGG